MFDELDEQIRRDDDADIPRAVRRLRAAGVILLSVALFCGLYAAIRYFEA